MDTNQWLPLLIGGLVGTGGLGAAYWKWLENRDKGRSDTESKKIESITTVEKARLETELARNKNDREAEQSETKQAFADMRDNIAMIRQDYQRLRDELNAERNENALLRHKNDLLIDDEHECRDHTAYLESKHNAYTDFVDHRYQRLTACIKQLPIDEGMRNGLEILEKEKFEYRPYVPHKRHRRSDPDFTVAVVAVGDGRQSDPFENPVGDAGKTR